MRKNIRWGRLKVGYVPLKSPNLPFFLMADERTHAVALGNFTILDPTMQHSKQLSLVKTRWRTFGHRNNLKDSSFYVLGRVYLEWFVVQIYLSSMMNQCDNILISIFIDRNSFMRSLHFPSFQFHDL